MVKVRVRVIVFLTIRESFLQLYFEIEEKQIGTFAYCSHVVAHKVQVPDHRKTGLYEQHFFKSVCCLAFGARRNRCWRLRLTLNQTVTTLKIRFSSCIQSHASNHLGFANIRQSSRARPLARPAACTSLLTLTGFGTRGTNEF